ncbi:MAG: gliding motility-associated C-terminal domain-containing protein [Flavobacteriales bacterium]|nr:gliding motility-associated C-terminal domain-containing protein [Flavobacteriales bacterium]
MSAIPAQHVHSERRWDQRCASRRHGLLTDRIRIRSFDRWGRTLHRTDDPEFRWSGDGVPVGVYAYTLNYAWQAQQAMHTVQRNGSVSLLR